MKNPRFLPCLIVALSVAHAGETLPVRTEFGAKASVPVGAEASLELPAKVKLGESIPGIFAVKNAGNEPIEITTGGDYRGTGFPLRLKIRVTDSEGIVLPDTSSGLPNFGGFSGPTIIPPGASHDLAFPLAGYVTFPSSGNYQIEACHDLGWIVDDANPHPVAKTSIEIDMPTAEEALTRVHSLCTGNDEDRLFQLGKLGHDVFLPALLEEAEAGNVDAVAGIAGIPGKAAFEALLQLLRNPSLDVVKAAGTSLKWRLPDLEDPSKPAFRSWEETPARLKDWNLKYRAPLLESALALLKSSDSGAVEIGAFFIQAQGDEAQAKALLDATQTALDGPWEIRSGKGVNVLDPPAPLRGLISAIDALRFRGWRTAQDTNGGSAVILARFRELADPKMPRPIDDRWKQTVIAFITSNPPTFRQNAILAIPSPITEEFEKPLLNALDDKDWGVLRTACEVAGKSGRKSFIRPLCQIVETTHETFVQSAASSSAFALGARVELWDAWCEVITDQDFMYAALRELAVGTINLPTSSSSGSSNFTREQRFAIRDEWRAFLTLNRDRLASGERLPHDDPSITPMLTGVNFDPSGNPAIEIRLEDGTRWPPR